MVEQSPQSADWHWINLPGGFNEKLVADVCSPACGAAAGRCCIVVQTNAMSSLHVIFSSTPHFPSRDSDNPVLRFVVGKRKNSMTAVGFGNPYLKKEPVDFTKQPDALLTTDEAKSRTYWFLYDRNVGVAAMGVQHPQTDLTRLLCRFRDSSGFRQEMCESLRYIAVSSGKKPVSLSVKQVLLPPDISILPFKFDPAVWCPLSWYGNSCVFELDEKHKQLVQKVQKILMESPIAPLYGFVEPHCLCLNAYRLLDPLRKGELFPNNADDAEWKDCHTTVYERTKGVLASAPWTYIPLSFERADCTTISLAPTGQQCAKAIKSWASALQESSGLRSSATNREMMQLTFAFEVFPLEGETASQARRDVVKQITDLLLAEWGTMEFADPKLVCWRTHTEFVSYRDFMQEAGSA